jgi:hypothetical protein
VTGLSLVEWACAGSAMNSASRAARVSDGLNTRYLFMIAPWGDEGRLNLRRDALCHCTYASVIKSRAIPMLQGAAFVVSLPRHNRGKDGAKVMPTIKGYANTILQQEIMNPYSWLSTNMKLPGVPISPPL